MKSLATLNLCDNMLEALPESIGKLPALKVHDIYLSKNSHEPKLWYIVHFVMGQGSDCHSK